MVATPGMSMGLSGSGKGGGGGYLGGEGFLWLCIYYTFLHLLLGVILSLPSGVSGSVFV